MESCQTLSQRLLGLQGSVFPQVVRELVDTGTLVSSGPLPLQNWVKTLTIFSSFEDQHVLDLREFQETKAGTGGTVTLGRNKR